MSAASRVRRIYIAIGVVLIGGGLLMIGNAVVNRYEAQQQVNQRGQTDSNATTAWKGGGSNDLKGAVQAASVAQAGTCSPGGAPASQYAFVQFTGLPQYNYAGVAGDGTWDMLHQRSMVHYTGTPAPGQAGNVIIAFHREPDYEHIDQLVKGGTISIQDRQCHEYVYTINATWVLMPNSVTQLNPTGGYNLTMITCTPFWQDYDRIVWRATLTAVDGKPFAAPA